MERLFPQFHCVLQVTRHQPYCCTKTCPLKSKMIKCYSILILNYLGDKYGIKNGHFLIPFPKMDSTFLCSHSLVMFQISTEPYAVMQKLFWLNFREFREIANLLLIINGQGNFLLITFHSETFNQPLTFWWVASSF